MQDYLMMTIEDLFEDELVNEVRIYDEFGQEENYRYDEFIHEFRKNY